jgi:uncharacterized protein YcfJ
MNTLAKFRAMLAVLAITSMLCFVTGCNKNESTLGGVLIGGVTGAAIGGAVNGGTGAAVGAVIGAVGGGVVGNAVGDDSEAG